MLLNNVAVNFLVVAASIFFLSFSKGYVVSNTANSSVRLGIIFSYLEWDTHWSRRNATRPIKLDVPRPMSCSASFTASAGFQEGSAAVQSPAASANPRTRKILRGLINVILIPQSREKKSRINFRAIVPRANEQRCFASLNMTALFIDCILIGH